MRMTERSSGTRRGPGWLPALLATGMGAAVGFGVGAAIYLLINPALEKSNGLLRELQGLLWNLVPLLTICGALAGWWLARNHSPEQVDRRPPVDSRMLLRPRPSRERRSIEGGAHSDLGLSEGDCMDTLGDGDVPGWWLRLGLPGVVDIHTHFLPERMMRRVWAHFDEAGPLIGRPWPIEYRWDQDRRLAHLRQMGVRRFTALTYAHRLGMAADLTDFALDLAAAEPDCVPSATFFPEDGVLDQVRSALDRGARVFKIHAQVGGFDLREPVLDDVWGLLADAAVPVVVHVGSGPVPRVGFTGPDKLEGVLRRHPQLTAVVAHLGAPEYDEFLTLAERYPRVHLDTTMVFTDFFEQAAPFPADLLPRLADLPDRVVLGSDFPNIPYPYARQLEALERLCDREPRLDDEWLRGVCWFNGQRLIGEYAVPPAVGKIR